MKVIVTGANGFVGREVVGELVRGGDVVFGVGRSKKPDSGQSGANDYFAADVSDGKNLTGLEKLDGMDAVVHCAGLAHQFGDITKERFYRTNVSGTKNVAELAVKIEAKQFILISSTAVYGIVESADKKNSGKTADYAVIDEDTVCRPATVYAESKLEAEKICLEICRRHKLPLTILRLAPVIGENNVGNTARLIGSIDRRRFLWIGAGENLKTLIYKMDVARAVSIVLHNKKDAIEIFNVAAEPLKMNRLVGEIEKNLKKNAPNFHLPVGILQKLFTLNEKLLRVGKITKTAALVERWLSDDVYSARKIQRDYAVEARTSTTEAIRRQVNCYLSEKNKS